MADESEVDQSILVKFAQKLADNEKRNRDKAIKSLRKWLSVRSQGATGFTEVDMMKVWKGLHYCMWMADKPLIQEELADRIAALVSVFHTTPQSLLFLRVFLATEGREWFGLDRLRLEKFMLLIRRVVRSSLRLVQQSEWDEELVKTWAEVYCDQGGRPEGLLSHLADIYLDELSTAGANTAGTSVASILLRPYCDVLAHTSSKSMFTCIKKKVFDEIIMDLTKSMKDEKSDNSDDEDCTNVLRLQVSPADLAQSLFDLAKSKTCLQRNRKPIYHLVQVLQDLAGGIVPTEAEVIVGEDIQERDVNIAADNLMKFEAKLAKSTGKAQKERLKKEKARKARRRERDDTTDIQDEPASKKQRVLPPGEDEPNSSGSDKENHHHSPEGANIHALSTDGTAKCKPKNKFRDNESEIKTNKKGKKKKAEVLTKKKKKGEVEMEEDDNLVIDDHNVEISPISKDEAALFMGGFVSDSDDDTPAKTKKKKKRDKTLNVKSISPISENLVESMADEIAVVKSSKKVKRKSLGKVAQEAVSVEQGSVGVDERGNGGGDGDFGLFGGEFFNNSLSDEKVSESVKKSKRKSTKVESESVQSDTNEQEISILGETREGNMLTSSQKKKGKRKSMSGKTDLKKMDNADNVCSSQAENEVTKSVHDDSHEHKNSTQKKKKSKRKSLQLHVSDEMAPVNVNLEENDYDDLKRMKSSAKKVSKRGSILGKQDNKNNTVLPESSEVVESGDVKDDLALFSGNVFDSPAVQSTKVKNKRRSSIGKGDSSDKCEILNYDEGEVVKMEQNSGSPFLEFTEKSTKVNKTKAGRRKSLGAVGNDPEEISTAKKSKKKRKSVGDAPEQDAEDTPCKKSSRKVKGEVNTSGDTGMVEEVEIFVPNKKYKGPLKEAFAKQATDSTDGTVKKKKPTKKDEDDDSFVKFEQLTQTPPAFVKKALLKISKTPKSAVNSAKKGSAFTELLSPGSNRKVIFNMSLNKSQDFNESLTVSPQLPFNPSHRPDQGILKPSPLTKHTHTPGSPRVGTPKQKLFQKKRRSTATDFF